MKNLKWLQPKALPFDIEAWEAQPFSERVRLLCQAWAIQGYGAPASAYLFYIFKMLLYVAIWFFFCSFSTDLGGWSAVGDWWWQSEALLKLVLWSMLFELLGFGCGSGPLTARYFPPFGGCLYFARPGTIKLPLFPQLPLLGRDQRSWLEVLAYLLLLALLLRALLASEVSPELLWPTIILLPLLALMDKTLFLAARGEHYWVALLCFCFIEESWSALKWAWLAIWWGAASSKLNRHFPAVIGVMISNHPLISWQWLKRKLYRKYPDDLRPSGFAAMLAHSGTVIEYTFPILLLLGDGGALTLIGLTTMFLFHLYITSSIPMGVPLEWNVIMVYGAFVLFGAHAQVALLDVQHPLLISVMLLFLLIIPILGNCFPKYFSFLLSMRYYAGNWAYSVWLFKGNTEEKLDQNLIKTSPTILRQLSPFYEIPLARLLIAKVIAFRSMHLHGRALQLLLPKAIDDIEAYRWRDGELVAGVALGWNFGDGHLHHEQLLAAIQKRCQYKSGELRCIFVESQPIFRPHQQWRIVDAKDGLLESGQISIDELEKWQPYPTSRNQAPIS
ncbi:MAG: DUF3556 domain-containing protein [Bacteroidota bacterium]